jgi:hypothetical protein
LKMVAYTSAAVLLVSGFLPIAGLQEGAMKVVIGTVLMAAAFL